MLNTFLNKMVKKHITVKCVNIYNNDIANIKIYNFIDQSLPITIIIR